jgi:hypothetical protein
MTIERILILVVSIAVFETVLCIGAILFGRQK